MKKLLVILTAVLATVVTLDMTAANRCNTGSCHKPRCETRCAPKSCENQICETEYINDAIPLVDCEKMVPVKAPCSVKKIVHTSYEPFCPAGYNEVSARYEGKAASRSFYKKGEKAGATKQASRTRGKTALVEAEELDLTVAE